MLLFTRRDGDETVIHGELPVQVVTINGKESRGGGPSPISKRAARHEISKRRTATRRAPQEEAAQRRKSTDDEIRLRIVNFLLDRYLPSLRRLDVEVCDGEVVITGFVRTYHEKQVATHCCQRGAGVLEVINNISVFQPDPESSPDDAELGRTETERKLP